MSALMAVEDLPAEAKREQGFRVMMSERLQDIMRDPRWSEIEREKLVRMNLDAINGKPFDQIASEEDLRAAIEGELLRMEAREAATHIFEEKRNPREPLILLTDDDILARPLPEWWIDGILPKSTETMIASPGGLGKTFLAIHLARCLASQMQFFGRKSVTAKTLYVVAEGASAFGVRAASWNQRHPHWLVPTGSIQYLERGVNLSLPKSVDELREVFRAGDFDVLVIDTLSQLSGLEDENSPAKVAQIINAIRSIREVKPGASSIIIHHTDARATKARGASSMRDNVDVLWMLKADTAGGFSMTSRNQDGGKMKDGVAVKLDGFSLESEGDSAVLTCSGKAGDSPHWPTIRDALADGEPHLSAEIRTACGVLESSGTEYDVWKAYMAELVRGHTVVKIGTRGPKVAYQMAPIPGS